MFMAAALVAALGAGTVFGYRSFKPAQRVSDLQLTNAEALSSSEFDNPCDDPNGYKKWKTERPWFWSDEEAFNDCCSVLRTGFSPEGTCVSSNSSRPN